MPLGPSSRIFIIGSGAFGLSTALWLARSGYKDVTVFDMQDTESAGYDPDAGIDSASADLNKIIRFSYGSEIEYQRLAFEAGRLWEEWNRGLASASASGDDVPHAFDTGERKLWYNCGFLRMSVKDEYEDFELRTLANMQREGIRDTQFRCDTKADVQRAAQTGWAHKLDPCRRRERLGFHGAVLDSSGGFVVAYKCCAWAQHLARKAGVRFVLGPIKGRAQSIRTAVNGRPMVVTADGRARAADLVVVAGGGWTPGLVPEASHLLETTAGSVATVHIPASRPDLRGRFSPENFPVVSWGMRDGKGIYALPMNDHGVLKIGYRKTKYTNFEDVNGRRLSVPKTAHVTENKESNIPMKALDAVKDFITTNLPELAELGISSTKLCWYTDSIDNSFVVDYVPGRPGVAICSGGSGHGFKFLPILGREVVRILEGKAGDSVYAKMWQWRESTGPTRNGLEQGEDGPRVLAKQKMATAADRVI